MRLIDADALIKFIDNRYHITWKDDYEGGIKDACMDILEEINKMPTIEPERKTGKWIPCRECLPEKSEKYLVTVQNGNVYAGTYDKYSGRFQCAATAWMELPAPYQEDD